MLKNPKTSDLSYVRSWIWKINALYEVFEPIRYSGLSNAAPAGAIAPLIYFPGALIYSAGFNVNQNFKKKIFLNNSMFQFFRSTPVNTYEF
jgi:hypothetical protein